jgi:enoyl-CoA hydratase/carnithine racemase
MTYETIRLEPAGDAAAGLWLLLTLNRPEAMNAMNTQKFIDLRAAMRELAVLDELLRAVAPIGARWWQIPALHGLFEAHAVEHAFEQR